MTEKIIDSREIKISKLSCELVAQFVDHFLFVDVKRISVRNHVLDFLWIMKPSEFYFNNRYACVEWDC